MKKIILIAICFVSFTVMAQKDKREQIKALKIAFITEQLNLSEKESQAFWPVYNAFEQEKNNIRFKEMRAIRKEIKENLDTMTDVEANALIERLNKAENSMHNLRMELPKKLSNIIPAKKIIKLKVAEEDFKKKMLNELKKRKKERG